VERHPLISSILRLHHETPFAIKHDLAPIPWNVIR